MTLLVVGLILFFAVHLLRVFAPGFRTGVIAQFGKPAWVVFHSLASIVTLVLVIYGFAQARDVTDMLWFPLLFMKHITVTLMLIAMICLVAGFLPAGHIATKTRHPIVLSIKIWAFAHLLARGDTASVLLFGSFLAYGVLLRISLKRRERAGEIAPRPFVSVGYDIAAVILGAALWFLIIWKLHEWLIGVQPISMG